MSNFLDLCCPCCGDSDRIDIVAQIWVRVTDDGTDADASECGDHEYTPDSTAMCAACRHCGTLRDFDPETEQPWGVATLQPALTA